MKLPEMLIVVMAIVETCVLISGASQDETWIKIGPLMGVCSILTCCVSILPRWIRHIRGNDDLKQLLCFMLPLVGVLVFFNYQGNINDNQMIYILYGGVFAYVIAKIIFKRWFAKKHGVPVNQTNQMSDNEKL